MARHGLESVSKTRGSSQVGSGVVRNLTGRAGPGRVRSGHELYSIMGLYSNNMGRAGSPSHPVRHVRTDPIYEALFVLPSELPRGSKRQNLSNVGTKKAKQTR